MSEENHEQRQRQWDADLRKVCESPEGLRVLAAITRQTGLVRETGFVGSDFAATAHNLGRRNMGVWLLGQIARVAPESLKSMELF